MPYIFINKEMNHEFIRQLPKSRFSILECTKIGGGGRGYWIRHILHPTDNMKFLYGWVDDPISRKAGIADFLCCAPESS